MPAEALFTALKEKSGNRVVISDVKQQPSAEAVRAGVKATDMYVDYFLR
jgi:hypothetical protein